MSRYYNPADSAAEVYEEFHGAPSEGVTDIEEAIHYHGHLAELGILTGLKFRTLDGQHDITLEFDPGEDEDDIDEQEENPFWGRKITSDSMLMRAAYEAGHRDVSRGVSGTHEFKDWLTGTGHASDVSRKLKRSLWRQYERGGQAFRSEHREQRQKAEAEQKEKERRHLADERERQESDRRRKEMQEEQRERERQRHAREERMAALRERAEAKKLEAQEKKEREREEREERERERERERKSAQEAQEREREDRERQRQQMALSAAQQREAREQARRSHEFVSSARGGGQYAKAARARLAAGRQKAATAASGNPLGSERLAVNRLIRRIPVFMYPEVDRIETLDDLEFQIQHEIDLAEEGEFEDRLWTPRQHREAQAFLAKVRQARRSGNPRGRHGPLESAGEFTGSFVDPFRKGVTRGMDRLFTGNPYDDDDCEENPYDAYDDEGPVLLCSNEDRNQLYLVGGDQSIDLEENEDFWRKYNVEPEHDSVILGECWAVAYATRKKFDGFDEVEYVHTFGPDKLQQKMPKRADLWEEAKPPKEDAFYCGILPTLRYDVLNQRLFLDGGSYFVTAKGIEE